MSYFLLPSKNVSYLYAVNVFQPCQFHPLTTNDLPTSLPTGWMYETRTRKMSLKTKIWYVLVSGGQSRATLRSAGRSRTA